MTDPASTYEAPIDIPPVPDDLEPPELSENAQVVLRRRYLVRDENGAVAETPQEMFWRVAWAVAQAEKQYGGDVEATARRFYRTMARLDFLPNSPTLMNAGRPLGQLAACFVLPIEDSLGSIFDTLKHAALVHQSGGGTGFDFSKIRPEGDPVKTTHGVASGPLSFLRIYNSATEEIKQGGTRRGANMGILRVDHPDILDFVAAKKDTDSLTNFNLSVAVTEDFMDALAKGGEYSLIHPKSGEPVGTLDAKKVFEEIAETAWESGEPGLFFVDRVNDTNPVQHVETVSASNPCGEQGLAPYDSCNLGSIDLARHVRHKDGKTDVDWEMLEATTRLAVRFLDDVIDVCRYPLPEIEEKTRANRRIGLGVMGFARLLMKLGVAYDSSEGRAVADGVMTAVERFAHDESAALAEDRGTFPNFKGSTWDKKGRRMRNAACTTVAPTGTISMIADTSGGCEPEYSLVYVKRCLDGTTLPYVVPPFVEAAKREGWWSDGLLEKIADNRGSAKGLDAVPKDRQKVFATAYDIRPEDHVRMQAVFQEHVDNAVSKTINLPKDANPDDVARAYRLAYDTGCKGITVYREGSRPEQVLDLSTEKGHDGDHEEPPTGQLPEDGVCYSCDPVLRQRSGEGDARDLSVMPGRFTRGRVKGRDGGRRPEERAHASAGDRSEKAQAGSGAQGRSGATPLGHRGTDPEAPVTVDLPGPAGAQDPHGILPRPRPAVTAGWTHKIATGCGTLYITINEDDQGPAEVIAVLGRANAHTQGHIEATSQMVSLALRCGVDIEAVVDTLKGIRCGTPAFTDDGRTVYGCADAIAQALERQMLGPDGPQHPMHRQEALDSYDAKAEAFVRKKKRGEEEGNSATDRT